MAKIETLAFGKGKGLMVKLDNEVMKVKEQEKSKPNTKK